MKTELSLFRYLFAFVLLTQTTLLGCAKLANQADDAQRDQYTHALGQEAAAKPFTVVAIPDTQYYTDYRRLNNPDVPSWGHYFDAQVDWILKERANLDIAHVLHVGDITQHDEPVEWEAARRVLNKLDGSVSYSLAVGNHDMGYMQVDDGPNGANTRETHFNEFFPKVDFSRMDGFGGTMGETSENSYFMFEREGMKFMVMTIELKPRDETLAWANQVIASHPEHRVILVTHAYLHKMQKGRKRIDVGMDRYRIEGNNAAKMWDKLVSQHENIFLVVCGHITGIAKRSDKGVHGNTVHQVLVDYQGWVDGGESWLAYFCFHPAKDQISVHIYNPIENEELLRYHLDYPMGSRIGSKKFADVE